EGHHGVDEAPVERLGGVVLAAEEPDLLGPLEADRPRHKARAVAGVEAAHPRPGLAETGVVGRDREIADQMEHMATADGVAGHHGDDGLGKPPDLYLQVEDVETAYAAPRHLVVAEIAVVASHPLVAPGAERVGTLTREEDHPDGGIIPRH